VNFDGFEQMDFGPRTSTGFVYVLCFVDKGEEIPFYVGQTQAILGRLNDYYWAQFQASTDFRIGEAVKHLNLRGIRVIAKYKASEDRRAEEKMIIAELHAEKRKLLNDFKGFDYRTAQEDDERTKAQKSIEQLLERIVQESSENT
jgi:hypothetical protein